MCDKVNVDSLTRWMREFARAITENEDLLTQLDLAIGDGDHGINMSRGTAALVAALDEQCSSSAAGLLRDVVGMTLMSAVGGASGALYGTFFLRMATAAGEVESLDAVAFAGALRAGLDGMFQRGQAVVGDKTMADALVPAIEVLNVAVVEGVGLGVALRIAAVAAEVGRDATIPMIAHKGKASYLKERSVGHQDPGATSAALLIAAAAAAFADLQ